MKVLFFCLMLGCSGATNYMFAEDTTQETERDEESDATKRGCKCGCLQTQIDALAARVTALERQIG